MRNHESRLNQAEKKLNEYLTAKESLIKMNPEYWTKEYNTEARQKEEGKLRGRVEARKISVNN